MSASLAVAAPAPDRLVAEPLRLHIGGEAAKSGWRILNVQPGPAVDYVGDCQDLSFLDADSVEEVYASHVLDHLGYQAELPRALGEICRVLVPGGRLRISVPDLDVLCRLAVHPALTLEQRFHLMRVMYGGQMDRFDFHKVGYTFEILCHLLGRAGFDSATRVARHGLFSDTSELRILGHLISLNLIATK
ncbi:MAG TPA: methyltransferase domain-containing protein [Geminicoccaceae bacterium]